MPRCRRPLTLAYLTLGSLAVLAACGRKSSDNTPVNVGSSDSAGMAAAAADPPVAPAAVAKETEAGDTRPVKVVVIGSSSAAGKNLEKPMYDGRPGNKSWVKLYGEALSAARPGSSVVDLARAGTTSWEGMPTGTTNPPEYPAPDPARNITAALAERPNAVIVSYALGKGAPTAMLMKNLGTIRDTARAAGVTIWVGTPTPRPQGADDGTAAPIAELKAAILEGFGKQALDFTTPLAEATGAGNRALLLKDNQHPNQAGHNALLRVVMNARIPAAVLAPPNP